MISLTEDGFYKKIAKDAKTSLIHMISEAGWGKTSSLRTIIQKIKEKDGSIEWVILDVSQAWYHNAPVKWRQLVTREKLSRGQISNQYDTVYEIGSLTEEERRAFAGTLIGQQLKQRYQAKLEGKLDAFPIVCFVMEEADCYFGLYSFKTNDDFSQIFKQYVSVGRNYKMRGFLISTANVGEVSPSLRRRTRRIYGRVISESDINEARRIGNVVNLRELKPYNFVYQNQIMRIPDIVDHTPEDFITESPIEEKPMLDSGWWLRFFGAIAIFLMFWAYLMRM